VAKILLRRQQIALLTLVFATGSAVMALSRPVSHDPVYSVAAVRANLAHDARDWVGRTILVRGGLTTCMAIPSEGYGPCAALVPDSWQPSRVDPSSPAEIEPLPVTRAGLDPRLTRLRRVPLLGELMPAPQVLHWGAISPYRVQLRAIANSPCGAGICFEAVLLDAAQ
jgi:hypothetical protein